MTVYEAIQLLNAFENRLDVQWGVFITVHLALFGGIIYIDRPLKRAEKVAALVIYAGFALINYLVSMDLAASILAAQTEVANYTAHECCADNQIVAVIGAKLEGPGTNIAQIVLLGSHVIMFLLVLLSVFFDRERADPLPVDATGTDEGGRGPVPDIVINRFPYGSSQEHG